MEKIKKFFNIKENYKFEMNDLRAFLQLVNVALIIFVGFNVGAIFGLVIAICGLIKDFLTDRHINSIALHMLGLILNLYILCFI